MSTAPAAEYVERTGKIFTFGAHPGKQFSLTAAEYRAKYPDGQVFEPGAVKLNMNHLGVMPRTRKLPVDGRLGYVVAAEAQGDDLVAKVMLNRHFDALMSGLELRTSAEFHPHTKDLFGLAIDTDPQIPDAVLMTTFSKVKGDEPDADDETHDPYAHIKDEGMRMVQMHHDMAAHHNPALCETHRAATFCATPARDRALAGVHDSMVEHGATCPGRTPRTFSQELPVADETEIEDVEIEEAETEAPVSFSKYQALEAQVARLTRAGTRKDAEAFADKVRDRILPHERKNLIVLFTRAAQDDEESPDVVTFSNADKKDADGSRLDVLKASYEQRPKHNLRDPKIGDPKLVLLTREADDAEDEEAEKKARELRRKQNQEYA